MIVEERDLKDKLLKITVTYPQLVLNDVTDTSV